MNIELTEIFSKPILNINPYFVHGIRSAFQQNLNGRVKLENKKTAGFFLPLNKAQDFLEAIYATDNPQSAIYGWGAYITDQDQFINIINVNGPITRGGGACSIGSKQHRDQVMFAVSRPNCIGHIFYIDTPGGSAFSKNDYAQAIEAIHNAGMKAYAIVDGNAYSAGQALVSMCDEVYYTHEKDGFGCIGSMAAFYTRKNGSKNEYTDETYRELYDPESFDKNAEFRALANDDDETAIVEELRKDGEEFRALVKQNRPNVTDEMLHGKTYDAKEVEGILNDGKRSLAEMIQIIADEYKASVTVETSAPAETDGSQNHNNTNQIFNNMNTPFINAAIGNELIVKDGGSYFVETMIQQVEDTLAANSEAQQSLVSATATIESLNATIEKMKEEMETLTNEKTALTELNNSLTAERDAQAESHNTDVESLNSQLSTLNSEIESLNSQLSTLNSENESLNSQVENLNSEIAERDNEIAELQKRGTIPPTSPLEETHEEKEIPATANAWDENKSFQDNLKAIRERDALLSK